MEFLVMSSQAIALEYASGFHECNKFGILCPILAKWVQKMGNQRLELQPTNNIDKYFSLCTKN